MLLRDYGLVYICLSIWTEYMHDILINVITAMDKQYLLYEISSHGPKYLKGMYKIRKKKCF